MAAPLELYPYQVEGVKFLLERPPELKHRPHRLLADEQGLGKTAQAIVAAREANAKSGLIICPSSVKYNWAKQLVLWGLAKDDAEIFIVRKSSDKLPVVSYGQRRRLYIVVNYEMVITPNIHRQLFSSSFDVGIFDECHRMKNMLAKRSTLIIGSKLGVAQKCFRKLLLSGTPIPNRPLEFFIILKTMAPTLIEPYTKLAAFGQKFCGGFLSDYGEVDRDTGLKWNFKGASNLDELRQRIKPFMLRRELREVYRQLPPAVEETIYLDVDINEHPEVIAQMADATVARTEVFDAEKEMPLATIRRIIGEAKIPQATQYILDMLATGITKIVVFAYHQNAIKDLYNRLELEDIKVQRIAGGTTAEQKQKIINRFIEDDGCRVLILQIGAGGEAIDGLQQVCNHIVYVELDWSEGGMRQTLSRLQRIGQTKTVFVKRLISKCATERIMVASLERKSSNINQLIKRRIENDMTIEIELKRIADALEAMVAGLNSSSASSTTAESESTKQTKTEKTESEAKPKSAKKGADVKKVTLQGVKAAANKFVNELGGTKDDAKALLKKNFKVNSLAELDESKYEKALELFEAGPEESSAADDDEI